MNWYVIYTMPRWYWNRLGSKIPKKAKNSKNIN